MSDVRQPEEVRRELDRILGSQALGGSDQLKRLLRLVVTRTLDGRSDLLKEYNLGLEAFQRPPDYDPKIDPIVRVQARRLRAKLEEYYAAEGALDPIVIHIPKGAYVPAFNGREAAARERPAKKRLWPAAAAGIAVLVVVLVVILVVALRPRTDVSRSVAVLPLKLFDADGARTYIADEIAEVLTTELAKNKELRVLSRTTASQYRETTSSLPEIGRRLHVRWVVEGGVGLDRNRTYVKLRAIDSSTDRKVWADVFDFTPGDLVAVNSHAADIIAAAIAAEIRNQESPPGSKR